MNKNMGNMTFDGDAGEEELSDDAFLALDLDKIIEQHEKLKTSLINQCSITTEKLPETSLKRGRQSDIEQTVVKCVSTTTVKDLKSTTTNLTRRKLASKRQMKQTPLFRLRYGRIWVTHVLSQHWCEQQMVFDLDPPQQVLEGEIEIIERPEVTVGATLHKARELEVQDVVKVAITSKEDTFALKVVNLYNAVFGLLSNGTGKPRREIPIFGAPFGLDVFIIGVIDEIRCPDLDSARLELVEFKTRRNKLLPGRAQARSHRLQVMLYKRMFDDLVNGVLSKECIAKHMGLNLKKVLGVGILEFVGDKTVLSLDHLLNKLFELFKSTPFIDSLLVEYAFQPDSSLIGVTNVKHDEEWLKTKLKHFSRYWKGERNAVGVDVEDLWKCNSCFYSDICVWRADLLKGIENNGETKSF